MGHFCIGKITGTHGIRGTLKVFPTTDDPKRFELLDEAIFDLKGKKEIFKIKKLHTTKIWFYLLLMA